MNPHLTYTDLLNLIDTLDVIDYAKTRNHLSGTVSRLSPYISRGVIDLPTIRDRILTHYTHSEAEKFIQELAWREYFQKVWISKGDAIFSDLRFPRTDWIHHELVSAIITKNTSISAVDDAINTLLETGYMHNHARLWTAMLAANVARAHWYNMGRFMYYHLLDGDLASNFLSWQWVAGTSSSKRYIANQTLINNCSEIKQVNSYLSTSPDLIGAGIIPEPLQAHEQFNLTTTYPASDPIRDLAGTTVFLYHPWSLDPTWRNNEPGERILVIEPKLFDHYPISEKVMNFIIAVAKTHIPTTTVYIGDPTTLPSIASADIIYSKSHPTTTGWPGIKDSPAELFPTVTGYFPSFFKFWAECQKTFRSR